MNQARSRLRIIAFLLGAFIVTVGCSCAGYHGDQGKETTQDSVASEMRQVLSRELHEWYPRCLDTEYGGYLSGFNYEWDTSPRQVKMIVTQARHIWSAANACRFYHDTAAYLPVARHGVRFLRDVMWDKQHGGFYDLVTREGEVIPDLGGVTVKRAYGNAFAIYALAAYFRESRDTSALLLAQSAFRWLDKNSHDPVSGGYFQFLASDGAPFPDGFRGIPPKDQNSSIHLLEGFTELYRVWPDPGLRQRLFSLLSIIRDTITNPPGYMSLFFSRDWKPLSYRDSSATVRERHFESDHVSFGHDVETAYLMLEASHALGIARDTATLRVSKRMVDHAIRNGWDDEHGGIYDGGYYFLGEPTCRIVLRSKEWWCQVEACNAFLMMSNLFPSDPVDYRRYFLHQWEYCKKYLIDYEHGGWYWGGTDVDLRNKFSPKGTIWKAEYHTTRALTECIERLDHPGASRKP